MGIETPEPQPFEEVPTVDEVQRLPEFNPLRIWDAMVAEYGDPLEPLTHSERGPLGIPETELER